MRPSQLNASVRRTNRGGGLDEKTRCRVRSTEVLSTTAVRTGGLCMPCATDPARGEATEIARRARETPARYVSRFSTTLNLDLLLALFS